MNTAHFLCDFLPFTALATTYLSSSKYSKVSDIGYQAVAQASSFGRAKVTPNRRFLGYSCGYRYIVAQSQAPLSHETPNSHYSIASKYCLKLWKSNSTLDPQTVLQDRFLFCKEVK